MQERYDALLGPQREGIDAKLQRAASVTVRADWVDLSDQNPSIPVPPWSWVSATEERKAKMKSPATSI